MKKKILNRELKNQNYISGDPVSNSKNTNENFQENKNSNSQNNVIPLKQMDRNFENYFINKESVTSDIQKLKSQITFAFTGIQKDSIKKKLHFNFILSNQNSNTHNQNSLELFGIFRNDKLVSLYPKLQNQFPSLEITEPKKRYFYDRQDYWHLGNDTLAICSSAEMQEQYRRAVQASSKPAEKPKSIKKISLLDRKELRFPKRNLVKELFSNSSEEFLENLRRNKFLELHYLISNPLSDQISFPHFEPKDSILFSKLLFS